MGTAYLIPNQRFQNLMPSNRKQKARQKHPQRNQTRARKRIPQRPRGPPQPALKAHKRRKNNKRRRQHISNGDTIDEHALSKPTAFQHRFDLDEGDGRVGAPEGETSGYEAEQEESRE